MLYHLLDGKGVLYPVMYLVSFLVGFAAIKGFMGLLPRDHGREFAVNGKLSEGKPRGAGIIMISAFVLCTALFVQFSAETAIYIVLIYAAMLTGYFDDAAKIPWGELKKGLLDLVITIGITANFMYHNPTDILMFGKSVHIPPALFAVLCVILVWASINVTNCCDGVDGECAMLNIATLVLFLMHGMDGSSRLMIEIMIMILIAYLWFNCSPSRILMGDAGSRALGVFAAVVALKSYDPFLFICFASITIVDGGIGLVKLSVRRFLKKRDFMDNIRTPLHDHWRKNLGVSDTQVVIRFTILQLIIGLFFVKIM